jgi:hypothetical protein
MLPNGRVEQPKGASVTAGVGCMYPSRPYVWKELLGPRTGPKGAPSRVPQAMGTSVGLLRFVKASIVTRQGNEAAKRQREARAAWLIIIPASLIELSSLRKMNVERRRQ